MFNIRETVTTSTEVTYSKAKVEADSMVGLLKWIEEVTPEPFQQIDSDRVGFYFASADAGATISVDFWREAVEKKIRFANPRNFPATLSNFVAASFATTMKIRGPNINMIGEIDLLPQLYFHAMVDMEKKRIHRAIIAFVPSFFNQEKKELGVLWIDVTLKKGATDEKDRANKK